MSYTIISETVVRRDSDGAFIPLDPTNRDCQEFIAWKVAGGVPTLAPAPAPPAKTRIYKAAIWRACTDQEFAAIKATMAAAPERLQALFDDVSYLDTTDELFPLVMQAATVAVGADRAAELLTPTE